jgi:alkanesulfonate monooxygenase SsuD/methylene tetrahydromethanopterin reductase-like flavin-dependent oxidoreductase (luciferase family)
MSVNVPINMKIDIEFNSGAQLPMDAIPELARLAEAHGFDCAWGGEANNKDPTVMLSAEAVGGRPDSMPS